VLLAEVAAAAVTLWFVRDSIHPGRLLDPAGLGRIALAALAMLPAAGSGWWLVHEQVRQPVAQVVVAACLGAVATACFALTLAALTGQLPELSTRAWRRLAPRSTS
jgi:hypothetical protein